MILNSETEMTFQAGDNTGDESPNEEESDIEASPDAETIEAYEAIMRSRLPSIQPVDLSNLTSSSTIRAVGGVIQEGAEEEEREDEKTVTKAEKQNAKKKRRKERERAMKQMIDDQLGGGAVAVKDTVAEPDPAIPFRLFSSTPVRNITLIPAKEDYLLAINPRHMPLSIDVADRIRHFAQSSAAAWESSSSSHQPDKSTSIALSTETTSGSVVKKSQLETIRLHPSSNPIPNIINILPISISSPHPPNPKSRSKPSHPSAPITKLHRVEIPFSPSPSLSQRQRRRITQSQPYPAQPSFWAPDVDIGGKANGYAYGYRGSAEGRREPGWGYVRS